MKKLFLKCIDTYDEKWILYVYDNREYLGNNGSIKMHI